MGRGMGCAKGRSGSAVGRATYRVVADQIEWDSPWEPILDLWRLGVWLLGVLVQSNRFVVFAPENTNLREIVAPATLCVS